MNHYLTALWPAPTNIHAYSTKRFNPNGNSTAPFENFNLGTHVSDNSNAVRENRQQLIEDLGLTEAPVWLNQIHGSHCVNGENSSHLDADAIISTRKKQVCTIMTADCLPILLCNRDGVEVAAIHGGWRSLVAGIIKNTIQKMKSQPQDILAWFGPAISQPYFEVGDDVYQAVCQNDVLFKSAFIKQGEKWLASLTKIATLQLQQVGINAIFDSQQCTFHQQQDYFSYRRKAQTGRIASLIWIS